MKNNTALLIAGLGALWFLTQKKDDATGNGNGGLPDKTHGQEWIAGATVTGLIPETSPTEEASGPSYAGSGAPAPVVGCHPPKMFRLGDTPDEGCLFFPHVPGVPFPPWGLLTPGWPINVGWSLPDLGQVATGELEVVGAGEVYGGAHGGASGLNIA